MAASNITFNLVANDKASKTVNKFTDNTRRMAKAAAFAAGAFAVGGLVAFGAAALTAATEGQAAEKKLSNVATQMDLFGKHTGAVTERLGELADAQARATGIDDDAILATQTKLMTFKELAKTADDVGGHFDRATTAALDLAAAGFGTAEGNAVQLGKALNDPVKGITALAKSGVTFTASEKDMIARMVEAGDVAGAQEMILKALETQVGGTAEASATATDKMKVKWGQFQEKMGGKLLPVMEAVQGFIGDRLLPAAERLADFIGDKVAPVVEVFWQALTGGSEVGEFEGLLGRVNDAGVMLHDWATAAGTYFTTTLIPAFQTMVTWIQQNRDWLSALAVGIGSAVIGWQLFTGAIRAWQAATKIAAAVQLGFNAVLSANPIGIIIIAIAALVAGLVWFFTKTETGKKIWAGFTSALSRGWELTKAAFANGYTAVTGWLGKAWDFIKKVWSFSPLGLIVTNWDKIIGFFKGLPGKVRSAASGLWDGIKDSFKSAVNWLIGKWNSFELTIGGGTILGKKMPSITLGTPNIPYLAKGGIATGPTLAVIGEGRETEVIQPLSKLGQFMRDYVPREQALTPTLGGMPSELVIVDSDGALIGRMKVEAGRAIADERRARRVAGR